MKKIIAVILVAFGFKASAQEVDLPTYLNHMMENPFVISPSYAGIGAGLQVRLNGVSQWVGVKGAPDTQSLTADGRFNDRLAGGVTLFNDKNGFTKQMGIRTAMAYHLTLSDFTNSFLSFALGANYTQFIIDTDEFETISSGGLNPEGLPNISQGTVNFDVSMLYRYEKFAISFNVINLLDKNVKSVSELRTQVFQTEPQKLRRYSLYPVYTHRLNAELELEPSIYFEYFESDGRTHTDLNVKLRKKIRDGYIWGGVSYTMADHKINDITYTPHSIAPMVGIKKQTFFVAYGVSFTLNEIADYNYGTHMITLGLDYNKKPSLARCTQNIGLF